MSRMLRVWYTEFRSPLTFWNTFFMVFYSAMILFRTLLNREIWFDLLGKILTGWGLYDANGELSTESLENFMLFILFTIFMLWAFQRQIIGEKLVLKKVLLCLLKVVGVIALTIEFLQVLLHVGTFQLSDLCYNTFGAYCII